MGRAYIVLCRNDLEDNALQVLDLRPNTSLNAWSNFPQTGYLTFTPQNDTVALSGAGPYTASADYYGLAAYLIDNVERVTGGAGNLTLSAAIANAMADDILEAVALGQDMTLAALNVLINANGVADSDLDGTVANSDSTGSVSDILRILSGEVYKVPAGATLAGVAMAFPGTGVLHTPVGGFVARTDAAFHDTRFMVETGEMHLSLVDGTLSQLVAPYVWKNPSFTYGATGTAFDIGGTFIPSTGAFRAVTVYDALGNAL